MKRIASFVALFIAVTALVFGVTPLVSAQSTSTRCTVAKPKLMTRIEKVEAANDAQVTAYTKIATKVDTLVASAEKNEYTTTALEAAVTSVTTKQTAYSQKALAFAAALKTASDAACGDSDSTYMTALTAARTAMTEARTASAAIKTAYKDEVIPALQGYAKFLNDNATEEVN